MLNLKVKVISRLVLVDFVFLKITSRLIQEFLVGEILPMFFSFFSELELPNRDKTHINMSLEVLDILKVII